MPRRIVRQPNGLYAEFSTIVDAFTILNMTEEEAYTYCRREMGKYDARAKVGRGKRDQKYYHSDGECGGGTWRWEYDLDTMKDVYGDDDPEVIKTIALANIPPDEWQRMYDEGEDLPEGMEWVLFE